MTVRKIVLATLGAALVASTALPALAAPDRPDPGQDGPRGPRHAMMQDVMFVRLLKSADTNKDGKITKDELATSQDTLFTAVDGNKDGNVTRGELLDYRIAKREEFRKADPAADMPQMDEDDDDDRPAPPPRAENEDRDGPRPERADRDDRDRDDRGPRGDFRREARWDRHGHGPMGAGFFRMIDEDRDGKISKAEAKAASEKLFARMDTNKDDAISIDDLPDRPL